MIKPKQKIWRKIQGLYPPSLSLSLSLSLFLSLSLSPHDVVSFCPANTVDSAFILFISPDGYLKSVVTNKLLYLRTKTEFCEFVNFSHAEFTTGFNYYLRHSDTAINTFKHVVAQPYIWCVMVQRHFWCVTLQLSICYYNGTIEPCAKSLKKHQKSKYEYTIFSSV